MARGTRGAYRKEDRVALPADLQKELVEKAAARIGNCQELAKRLDLPKSSMHYYRIGRLTIPISVLDKLLRIANDDILRQRIESRGVTKDRSWATEHAQDVFREMCRERVRLPTRDELTTNEDLRRKAARIVSYVLAEGSVWLQKEKFGEHAVNITFADYEGDLYKHFRSLSIDVFGYDIGPPQNPGNEARAIRGFIYSRFIAEWLVYNGVPIGDKAANPTRLPEWIIKSQDRETWIGAIQPWCDGEGGVSTNENGTATGFSLSQSRHTTLDLDAVPVVMCRSGPGRMLSRGDLAAAHVYGIPLSTMCYGAWRSEVFDDVLLLLKRLGLRPKLRIHGMYLKDDGFWSCNWLIIMGARECRLLPGLGLVTQGRKVAAIRRGT